jgi:hypothetical protein
VTGDIRLEPVYTVTNLPTLGAMEAAANRAKVVECLASAVESPLGFVSIRLRCIGRSDSPLGVGLRP